MFYKLYSMKLIRLFLIMSLLLPVSCKQKTTQPTGDLQYFELKGNVARLEDEWLFPDHVVSFDEEGYIVLPVDPVEIAAYSEGRPYPKDASYPLKEYYWAEEGNYECPGVSLLYDSNRRLLAIGMGFTSGMLEYDAQGRILAYHFESEGEEGVTRYKYDASGNRVEEETTGSEEILYNKMQYGEYEFDSHGNWISRKWTQLDQEGSIVNEGYQSRKGRILYW